MKLRRAVFPVLALLLAAGCASTPDRRIAGNPELFASFPTEAQARIRKGEVDIGFTPEMTEMALGEPRRIHSRVTEAGETEIWIYTGIAYSSSLVPVGGSYTYRDRYGRLHRAYDAGWVPVDYAREYPVLRLEFERGRLKAIEKAK